MLLYLGHKYDVKGLEGLCLSFLEDNITAHNALVLYDSALAMEREDIAASAFAVINNDVASAFAAADPANLHEKTIVSLCKHDELYCPELTLFNLVYAWIKAHNPTETQILNILEHVRLPLISSKDLVSVVKPTKVVPLEMYLEALEFSVHPSRLSNDIRFQARHKPQRSGVLGIVEHNSTSWKTFIFENNCKSWSFEVQNFKQRSFTGGIILGAAPAGTATGTCLTFGNNKGYGYVGLTGTIHGPSNVCLTSGPIYGAGAVVTVTKEAGMLTFSLNSSRVATILTTTENLFPALSISAKECKILVKKH